MSNFNDLHGHKGFITFPFLALLFLLCCSLTWSWSLLWWEVDTKQAVKLLSVGSRKVLLNQGLQHSSTKEKHVITMIYSDIILLQIVHGRLSLLGHTLQLTQSRWALLLPLPKPRVFLLLQWTEDQSPHTEEQMDCQYVFWKTQSTINYKSVFQFKASSRTQTVSGKLSISGDCGKKNNNKTTTLKYEPITQSDFGRNPSTKLDTVLENLKGNYVTKIKKEKWEKEENIASSVGELTGTK